MLKFVASFWIIFDAAICLRTGYMSGPFPRWEWWAWLVGGGALAVFAFIAEHFDRKTDRATADRLQEKLTEQKGFIDGAFTRMDHRLEMLGSAVGQIPQQDGELRDELTKAKNELESMKGAMRLTDRIGLGFEFGNNRAQLLIVNQDSQAEYFGVFNITGGIVYGDTTERFCRWVHTDAVRTKIAKGQTCRVLLARLETEPRMLTFKWVIETTTEKGPQTIPAMYSSCGSTDPLTRAPDIVLTGSIFRDPDIEGPQRFRVVLHAFGAALE